MVNILRTFFLSLLTLLPMGALAQSQMRLELNDGSSFVYVLSKNPKLTFANSEMVVTVSEQNTTFALANVKKFYFEDAKTSIEQTAATADVVIRYTDGSNVEVVTAKAESLWLYNAQGKLMQHAELATGITSIPLSTLPAGTYILKVGEKTVKLTTK